MKKLLCGLVAVLVSSTFLLGGCSIFGGNETVLDVTVNNTYDSMTDEQWKEYKDLLASGGNSGASLQASINGSLMSGVSIFTSFSYNDLICYVDSYNGPKQVGRLDYHAVYTGAGVIVELDKANGNAYVVTNCHVVFDDTSKETVSRDVRLFLYGQDARGVNYSLDTQYVYYGGEKVYYREEDGNEYYLNDTAIINDREYCIPAEVVCASVTHDIALLKVTDSNVLKKSGAVVAQFAESDEVYAGSRAYAVGNPEGDGMSATLGFVSKESEIIQLNLSDKDENAYQNYRVIRTDAAINGGNSGGGFYNEKGELIGIINSKQTGEEIDNMGYALPASAVKRLWLLMKDADRLTLSYGKPYVKAASFPAEYKIASTVSFINPQGLAEIAETLVVSSGGSGFKTGDVLKKLVIADANGTVKEEKVITRSYHVDDVLLSARSGDVITFTVMRGGAETTVSYNAQLGEI